MEPDSAKALLSDIERLRSTGRRRLASVWYPLCVFGVIYAGMAPLALAIGRDHLAPYFVLALIGASYLTARHYRRRADTDGVETSIWPWLLTSILMTVGGGAASVTGFQLHSQAIDTIGPFLVVSSFVLAFGLWTENATIIACGLVLPVVSLVSVPLATGNSRVALQAIAFAAILIWAAVHLRRSEAAA